MTRHGLSPRLAILYTLELLVKNLKFRNVQQHFINLN